MLRAIFCVVAILLPLTSFAHIKLGIDVLFVDKYDVKLLASKKVGLLTNLAAINGDLESTFEILKRRSHQSNFELVAVFAPEHGYFGDAYAYEAIADQTLKDIPLYGLEGKHRRPTDEMLKAVQVLVVDIQDIGSRSYTFVSTLFYCMEEAAKKNIPVVVLDRPNPMGGEIVDGLLLDNGLRSFLGYVNVPYCHGMTVGELARLFNEEYKIECELTVVPMKGWKREMSFEKTGLQWAPTSPQIPEADTPFFYPTTGLIGHLSLANIGIGYTLPFKIVGAPWIDAQKLADAMNNQALPGVFFHPFYFKPFYGKHKLENCQGIRILVTDEKTFLPVTTQYVLMGVMRSLYQKPFMDSMRRLADQKTRLEMFHKLNGNVEVYRILMEDKYVIWKMREMCKAAKNQFLPIRKKYLLYS